MRLAVLFFMAAVSATANTPRRAATLEELAPLSRPIDGYRLTEARLSWVDYAALRRDYASLRGRSNPEIDAWILRNYAYISSLQVELGELRNTPIPHDPAQRRRFHHPAGYGRAAVLAAEAEGEYMDLKGPGIGPESFSERRVQFALAAYDWLTTPIGFDPGELEVGRRLAEALKTEIAEHEKDLAELLPTEPSAGAEEERAVRDQRNRFKQWLQSSRRLLKFAELSVAAAENRLAGRGSRAEIIAALEALYELDHSSGLMSEPEARAEVARQRAAQFLFERRNAELRAKGGANPPNFQTVECYFIMELGFHIKLPGGKLVPAAIVGRQAHIPEGHHGGTPVPFDLVDDPWGYRQGDAMGALVDFGAVEIKDKSVLRRFEKELSSELSIRNGTRFRDRIRGLCRRLLTFR